MIERISHIYGKSSKSYTKIQFEGKKIATYKRDSSISTHEYIQLDFKNPPTEILKNILYLDKKNCPVGQHSVKHLI